MIHNISHQIYVKNTKTKKSVYIPSFYLKMFEKLLYENLFTTLV